MRSSLHIHSKKESGVSLRQYNLFTLKHYHILALLMISIHLVGRSK